MIRSRVGASCGRVAPRACFLAQRVKFAAVSEGRRTRLTPLESELRATDGQLARARPGFATRLRRRFRRKEAAPTTLAGATLHALLRLAAATAVATGIALLIDHWLGRSTALGFYIAGAALFAVAFSTSSGMSGRMGGWYYQDADARERRFNIGIAYLAAGAVVTAIGVAVEALG